MRVSVKRTLRTAFTVVAVALASGCGDVLASFSDTYTGPAPSREDIAAETVVIRRVTEQPGTGIQFFWVDRERYLGDPHDINRIVELTSRGMQAEVAAMRLETGDRVRVSTRFVSLMEAGGLSRYFHDWPYDRYWEYLIGQHDITAVERVAP